MSKQDKDAVIAAFTEAYEKANGKKPDIEAKGGWYSVDGDKNVRLAQLEEMTAELQGGKKEKPQAKKSAKAEKPAAKKSEKTKEKKKPAAKKAAKPKSSSKKKKSKGDFSVKDFWNDKITADNEGAILPR